MKIVELAGLVLLLFASGESFSVSIETCSRCPSSTRLHQQILQPEDFDNTRRSYLNRAITAAFAFDIGANLPTIAAAATTVNGENGMTTTKNKKLGGLALKIRSVGLILVSQIFLVNPKKFYGGVMKSPSHSLFCDSVRPG
jgi:hypothetical protein